MSSEDLERVIGRAVLDPAFRQNLLANPEKAIREAGFDLTEEEIAGLKGIDAERAEALAQDALKTVEMPWD
jgi:hypothetical protein